MAVGIILNVYARPCGAPIQRRPVQLPDGATVTTLLDKLTEDGDMPQKFGDGEGYSEFLVLLNGMNVMCGDDLSSVLHEGDVIAVMPALAGG